MRKSSIDSSSYSDPEIIANPAKKLDFGMKFTGPIKGANDRESESVMSSIDSKPSIKKKPKSILNLDIPTKPVQAKAPVQKLPSMKYTKNEKSSLESLSSDSEVSSFKGKVPHKEKPPKVLEPTPIPMVSEKGRLVYKPALNHIDLDDSPEEPAKPADPPSRPAIPPLPLNKIEGVVISNGNKEVKNFDIDSIEVNKLDSDSQSSSKSSKSSSEPNRPNKPKPNKNESSSSGYSRENSSYADPNDSLFKPQQEIILKKSPPRSPKLDPRQNESHSSDLKEIPLPPPPKNNDFMISGKFLSFSQHHKKLNDQSYTHGEFWEESSCIAKFCKCFAKSPNLSPLQMQELVKMERLSKQAYDNDSEFHRDLVFSLYCRLTNRTIVNMDTQALSMMGLTNLDYKKNELSQKFAMLNVLHQLFVIERKPILLRKLNEVKKPNNTGMFQLLNILMVESFRILKKKKLNRIFDENCDIIEVFFEFHSGVLEMWTEVAKDEEFAASVRNAFDRGAKNPSLCCEIFRSK